MNIAFRSVAEFGAPPAGAMLAFDDSVARLGARSDGPPHRGKHAGKNVVKPTRDALLERFRQAFPEAAIQIEDESHLHVGHAGAAGGAGHFRVRLIDARFNGLQRLARHRLVYDALSDWMPSRVHALNIIAMTLEEAGQSSTIQQSPSK